ncbi:hypothetical protein [Amycolatopsis pithecellobii]|uniref:Uncharacterized protein n=1 Tax=Amycolatopsis pithecellobii TaxID=664692 RepID=A0A6N7Z7F8_9PSEU|nr:hypothetical protein [Amycolatopsis pithecellobii]MTD57171.1 hypothetical protein [Amycolatopsis pithecellobii]
MTSTNEVRYVVEPGTDGSYLIVDRGLDRTGRRAISREERQQDAHQEADALNALDNIDGLTGLATADSGWGPEVDIAIADLSRRRSTRNITTTTS